MLPSVKYWVDRLKDGHTYIHTDSMKPICYAIKWETTQVMSLQPYFDEVLGEICQGGFSTIQAKRCAFQLFTLSVDAYRYARFGDMRANTIDFTVNIYV